MIDDIEKIKSLNHRTLYVGAKEKFPKGCKSCLEKNGLCSNRKTNKCNAKCKFCYYYGETENQLPVPDGMWELKHL